VQNFRAAPVTHVTGYDSAALDVALQLPVAAQKQFVRFFKSKKNRQAALGGAKDRAQAKKQ